jgi:hypothetical protein
MPRGHRELWRQRAGWRPAAARRAGCAGAAHPGHGLPRALSSGRSVRRGDHRCRALCPTLTRQDFDDTLRFVEDGGYALSGYERFRRLFRDYQGMVHVRGPQVARQLRMNLGTIVELPLLKVRMRGGPVLGEVEEWFVSTLELGDNFIFSGQMAALRADGRHRRHRHPRGGQGEPRVPAYGGSRMPLTTYLARKRCARDPCQSAPLAGLLPDSVQEWLAMQRHRSRCRRWTGCSSRFSRVAAAGSWSPIASRGGWRTRRWACW